MVRTMGAGTYRAQLCAQITKELRASLTAGMAAAAVSAAGVVFAMMVVMVAPNVGVKVQLAGGKSFRCRVRVAGNTAEQPDTRFLRSAP